jgi:DnaK suppressor protein
MEEAKARELLDRERTRIEKQLGGLKHGENSELSHLDQHMADDATELLEEEIDEGISDRLREELKAIERAEQRLAEGTYGKSVESGESIPDGRLELIPWAERTAEEESRFGG